MWSVILLGVMMITAAGCRQALETRRSEGQAQAFLERTNRHLTGQVFRLRVELEALHREFQEIRQEVSRAVLPVDEHRPLQEFADHMETAFARAFDRLGALEESGGWEQLQTVRSQIARLAARVHALRMGLETARRR